MSAENDDLTAELEAHLRMAIEERMARGESRESAERAARREFGNVTHITEVTREQHRGAWLERLRQDLAYGVRALRRTPAFTIVAVLTLALAIGANTAVFTIVNSVLLRPLPFRDPGSLYLVSHLPKDLPFSVPPGLDDHLWAEYRGRAHAFERVTGYSRSQFTLSGAGEAVRLEGAHVDADFFATLGVAPARGRPFSRDEETQGRNRVAILSDRLWRDRFGADPRTVGASITLDGTSHTVVGVMPPGFGFPAASEAWVPLSINPTPNNSFLTSVLGRLRAESTPAQAKNELESLVAALPAPPRGRLGQDVAAILPLKEQLTGTAEKSLLIFSGAVAFVLLIACANVANLLLIRAATRRREIAVRVALGASRARIATQVLTESVVVALAGGVVGSLIGVAGVRALLAIAPAGRIPRLDEVHADGWVLAFTLAVSIVTGVVFGLAPALASAKRQPSDALAVSARMVGGAHSRVRATLVAAEIALALVLLTGAGLLIRSFERMRDVDKGYDPAHVTTMAVDLPKPSYPDIDRLRAFHDELLDRLGRIPGVRGVGNVTFRPMSSAGIMGDFKVDGPTPLPDGYVVDKTAVSAGYFPAMGMRMLRGRGFGAADDARAPRVAVVSETVARRVWPDGDAIGKRISMANEPREGDWLTVVGIVNDVVQDGSLAKHSTIYLPYTQFAWPFFIERMTYVVRSDPAAGGVPQAMRAALRAVDANVPARELQTMDDAMLEVVAEPVFQMRLLMAFSLIALLLAAIGTYGVMAYDVAERTREIGLRIALGATPGAVVGLIMKRGGILAIVGAGAGVAGSLGLTRVLQKSLFEVEPTDPATLAIGASTIVAVALLAAFIPARRASKAPSLTSIADSL